MTMNRRLLECVVHSLGRNSRGQTVQDTSLRYEPVKHDPDNRCTDMRTVVCICQTGG